MYKLIIWDFDGTLADTQPGLVQTHKHIIDLFNLPPKRTEEILKFIGPLPKDVYHNVFNLSEQEALRAHNEFREYYLHHELFNATLYHGITDVLHHLYTQGVVLAIVSNKRQDCLEKLLQHFNISTYFKYIYGQLDSKLASKSERAQEILVAENIAKTDACIIGDTDSDKNVATDLGIDFIGVNYGYGFQNVPGYIDCPAKILEKISC